MNNETLTAQPIPNAIPIMSAYTLDGIKWAETSCRDYDQFATLPPAISIEGDVYARSGWNSDSCKAYYRTGWKIGYSAT